MALVRAPKVPGNGTSHERCDGEGGALRMANGRGTHLASESLHTCDHNRGEGRSNPL